MDGERLDDFRALIERESLIRSGRPIPSSTPEQAAIVLETFFSCAVETVRIVTGRLDARVYGEDNVVKQARRFLADENRSLTIIFLETTDPLIRHSHPLITSLQHNTNLHLLQGQPPAVNRFPYHFSLVDKDTFHFKPDPNSRAAITTFGGNQLAEQLVQVFSYLEQHSEVLALHETAS